MTRAIVFDLDDTLYPERRFALSGFAAVARHAEASYGIPSREAFTILRNAIRDGRRSTAFQTLAARVVTDAAAVQAFREVYRRHVPRIRLPRASRRVLDEVRRTWRIGLLTNGSPEIQRAKVAALGLAALMDVIVYAHEVSDGKPDSPAFEAVCDRLRVAPDRAVMAGDDPWCDIDGARGAGLHAIRIRRGWHRHVDAGHSGAADCTVTSLTEVPRAAERLVPATPMAPTIGTSVSHAD